MREAAIRLAQNKKISMVKLVEGLSKTERNFVLKRGESSVFDDKRDYLDNMVSKIKEAVRAAGLK